MNAKEYAEKHKFQKIITNFTPLGFGQHAPAFIVGYGNNDYITITFYGGWPAISAKTVTFFDGYEKYGSTFWNIELKNIMSIEDNIKIMPPETVKASKDIPLYPHRCPSCNAAACIMFASIDCSRKCR